MKTPTKEQLTQRLNQCFQETIDWVMDQPDAHFNKEIVAGKWTIAEQLYHLIKTSKAVSKGMSMPKLALRTMFGKNKNTERSYQDILDLYRSKLASTKAKAPKAYEAEPGRTFERDNLIKRLQDEQKDFITALNKWNENDMSVYQMPHPIVGKFTIREFVYFTILHTYHHLDILKEQYA